MAVIFNELEALKEIRDGKKLSEFNAQDYIREDGSPVYLPTHLMILCALHWHKTGGYKEVPDGRWSDRAAAEAVTADYHAMSVIPEERKMRIARTIAETASTVKRDGLKEYMAVLNGESDNMIRRYIKHAPWIANLLTPEKRNSLVRNTSQGTPASGASSQNERDFPVISENYRVLFSSAAELSAPNEVSAAEFLSLPVEEQTKERLESALQSEEDFPEDFIKRLSVPNRNAAFYTKHGDTQKAEYWKSRIIPYLNRAVCEDIADRHPEGSIATKPYLSKEAVRRFWDKKKEHVSKAQMAGWFMKFPKEFLDADMAEDMQLSREVLEYAPELLKDTDAARKHLNRRPFDVLYLPDYQTEQRILAGGVPLNSRTINMVQDELLKEKICVALGIQA